MTISKRLENGIFRRIAFTSFFFLTLFNSQFSSAQEEFELLYGMENGYSLNAQNQLVTQWAAHANSITKNTNCINQIEEELMAALSKNAAGLSIGIPYQAQVNYSACKLERMFIDTLSKEPPTPHLVKYHISGCLDPSMSIPSSSDNNEPLNEIPLLVTYLSTDMNDGGWKAFDHYGFAGPKMTEEMAISDLFYEMRGLKLLCEDKGYKVYQIKNATKHPTNFSVEQKLKDKGIDVNACYGSRKNPGSFSGRHQMLVDKYYDLEVRYILVDKPDGGYRILVRFTNRNPEFMAQARVAKGVERKIPSQDPDLFEIFPNQTLTLKLNEIVELEYNFTMPKEYSDPTETMSDKLINMAKGYIRKKVTVEGKKMKLTPLATMGVRG